MRALAAQGSRTNAAWEQAREERDFDVYRPELEKMIALKIEQADALRDGDERYDAMLDAFEPGMTTAELEPLLTGCGRSSCRSPSGCSTRRSPTTR